MLLSKRSDGQKQKSAGQDSEQMSGMEALGTEVMGEHRGEESLGQCPVGHNLKMGVGWEQRETPVREPDKNTVWVSLRSKGI